MLSPTTTTTPSPYPHPTPYPYPSPTLSDLISRSFHNLSTSLSRTRPFQEFLSPTTSFTLPPSLSTAVSNFHLNSKFFSLNYIILLTICSTLALISSPFSFTIFALLFALWLLFYFFREDPVIAFGYQVSDQNVLWGLILTSLGAVWYTGMGVFNRFLVGFSIGVLLCFVHGAFKNPEGLFLDENDAVSGGLVSSKSRNNGGIP